MTTPQLPLPFKAQPYERAYLAPGVGILRRVDVPGLWRLQTLQENGAPRWRGAFYLEANALKRMPGLIPVVIRPELPWSIATTGRAK